jgi:antitoxin ParD1/3/4
MATPVIGSILAEWVLQPSFALMVWDDGLFIRHRICGQSMIKYAQLDGGIMSDIERVTVTMPAEMAAAVKSAVDAGDYASTSEVVRAALCDWKMKRALQIEELAALKGDIDAGFADVAAGRVEDFDAARIVARGRKLLADRSPSA